MKKLSILLVSLLILFSGLFCCSFAADAPGSCTVTYASVNDEVGTITWAWTGSADNGTVPSTASAALKGWVFMATTDPGAVAPQAAYDIVINDTDSVDILGGELANLSATVSAHAVPKIGASYYGPRFVNGALTMVLTNNNVVSATGTVKVYFYRKH